MRKWSICARGRIRKRSSGMNKVEQACSMLLLAKKHVGEVLWFEYEGQKFRLADNQYYTPDFNVMLADGTMEMWEVKTIWRDGRIGITEDAREKVKMAAEKFPYVFRLMVKTPMGWEEREI